MNNEFKKSKSNNETRYTLESMTAGATGSGSVATSTGSLGKVQKRGNILAQEAGKDKVPATTPRNFVAKNAKSSGAGAHKDKKKEQKQGAEKHKKPYMESLRTKIDQLKSKLAEQGVAEGSDDKEPFDYEKWKASTVKPRKPRGWRDAEALGKAIDREQSELRKRKEQGVAEGSEDLASLRAKANEISNRIDAIVKGGGRVGLDDPLSRQLKAIRSKIQQAKKQGVAEGDRPFRGVGGAFNRGDDERHDLDPTDWYFVKDGKMFAVSVYPNQEREAMSRGYSRTRADAKAKASQQGVAEGEAPLKHHTARVSYHKEGDPHRRYEAVFKTTHNGGKEETEKRAKAAFAAKKKIVYDIVHEQDVAEGGYPEVDHIPGPTIKRTQTGCKRCHGKGYVYKTPDGETHPMNRPDAKKYKCGKCDGIGFVKTGVAEAGKDVKDIWAADTQMLNILLNPDRKQLTDYTPEEISQLQKLAKILGRARKIIGGKFTGMSIGQVLDKLEDNSRLKQRDGGKMPDFTGRATTTADMGKQIALHTNGNYYTSQGKTWTSGRTGQRIRDANDYIKYNDKKSLDDAWAWVQSKGKQVNYRDNFNQLQTAVQIGSFIVEPNTVTRDVSGGNPDTEHGLSVRSVKSLSQWSRKREEQGVAEGSEQQFMIYFVVPEHDDYPDRREPTERTIVVANSPGEAAIKFKAETPEAYIKDIVAMRQGVAEVSQQTLQSYRKKAAKQKSDALDVADRPDTDDATWVKNINIASKRKDGIAAANKRLGVGEGSDSEELADEVYAEFERTYPNLARRADERTIHAAIIDVLNYGGDSSPSALAQDVARAVKRNMQQGVSEGPPKDPNAPKLVQDRKTGKWYDPNKEFEKKMNSPEVMAQMKRMAQKEGVEDRTSYQVAKILSDRGIKYDPAQENELINAIGMVLVKELNMTPKEARNLISYDEDFVADTMGELRSMEQSVSEVDVYMESLAESLQQVLSEKAVSKKQQKFMGMVHAAQKGEKPASKEVAKVAKDMGKKDAKDFASTKHKGLPEKKKSKK
jgi:hypothetical protein